MDKHRSVLLEESIEGLAIKPGGVYIDATFGRGGHSLAILEKLSATGSLLAIDKDPSAIEFAKEEIQDSRIQIQHGSFASIATLATDVGIQAVDGILMDLGVSSPQLDEAPRGFSFMKAGPLDMRMDTTKGMTAEQWVNTASDEEMAMVFKTYGEERYALRIAKAIRAAVRESRITTTTQLAEIVKRAHPRWEKHKHPATRVFQAIRIYINSELDDLEHGLKAAVRLLKVGGRLVVISFHSLEDRLVKRFIRDIERVSRDRKTFSNDNPYGVGLKRIGKAIFPQEVEVKGNVRARSAVMRIAERMA